MCSGRLPNSRNTKLPERYNLVDQVFVGAMTRRPTGQLVSSRVGRGACNAHPLVRDRNGVNGTKPTRAPVLTLRQHRICTAEPSPPLRSALTFGDGAELHIGAQSSRREHAFIA
jgi:hypothetical protein